MGCGGSSQRKVTDSKVKKTQQAELKKEPQRQKGKQKIQLEKLTDLADPNLLDKVPEEPMYKNIEVQKEFQNLINKYQAQDASELIPNNAQDYKKSTMVFQPQSGIEVPGA